MRILISIAVAAVSLSTGCASPKSIQADPKPEAAAPEIKLEKIKAADIEKAIAKHKGKVVAVDIWANFCAPCKARFHHIVDLHKKHAKDGLVCISISVDEDDTVEGALDFLKKQNASFENFWLVDTDEAKDALEKKFIHRAPPIFHVYDRTGKHAGEWEGKVVDEEINALIEKLLKQ